MRSDRSSRVTDSRRSIDSYVSVISYVILIIGLLASVAGLALTQDVTFLILSILFFQLILWEW